MSMQISTTGVIATVGAPRLPVQYDEACRALAECRTINEALYWNNKSDALAAWAKIYKSDKATREAKQLKLHAYRRMAEIAKALRDATKFDRDERGKTKKGARSVLLEAGLKSSDAQNALMLAKLNQPEFDSLIDLPRPPSPNTFALRSCGPWASASSPIFNMLAMTRRTNAAELAISIDPKDCQKIRKSVIELTEWLDDFESHLPKSTR